jgi:hypothetical protein
MSIHWADTPSVSSLGALSPKVYPVMNNPHSLDLIAGEPSVSKNDHKSQRMANVYSQTPFPLPFFFWGMREI